MTARKAVKPRTKATASGPVLPDIRAISTAEIILEDEEWSTRADREIAPRCFVGHPLVASLRASFTRRNISEPEPRTYQDQHGNVTQMRTSAIGRKPADAPEPEAPAEPVAPTSSVSGKRPLYG